MRIRMMMIIMIREIRRRIEANMREMVTQGHILSVIIS